MTHTEWHNDKPSIITYYKFNFLHTKNQFCIISSGKDLTVRIYKLKPPSVTVAQEQEDNNKNNNNKVLFKQFLSNEAEIIIMLFAVSKLLIWGIGRMSPVVLAGGTKRE